jgi:hypothetical protein
MIIRRKSPITGKLNEMDLDITEVQLRRYYIGRELVNETFPNLNADEREFLMTGITPRDWNFVFPPEEKKA